MSPAQRSAQTPRQSVESLCSRRGVTAVVSGCVALLEHGAADVDPELVVALGGPPARWTTTGESPGPAYWLRVWAARGLSYAWGEHALPTLVAALGDEAWRVREMATKVVARHRLDDALELVADSEQTGTRGCGPQHRGRWSPSPRAEVDQMTDSRTAYGARIGFAPSLLPPAPDHRKGIDDRVVFDQLVPVPVPSVRVVSGRALGDA